MRCAPLALVSFVAIAVAACHGAPAEQVPAIDAAAPSAPSAPSAPAEARAAAAAPPATAAPERETDGGRSAVRDFCNDAYTADVDRLKDKCAPADLSTTEAMARAAANLCFSDISAALSRSRASFDADAAQHCVAMLRAKPLAQSSETDTFFQHFPCDRVLLGLQAQGQPCRYSVECKDGLSCVGYSVGVDGTCKKPPRPGEACEGQPFGTILNDAAASLHHPACARGAWCNGKTCDRRLPAGRACGSSAACAEGLACVMGRCAPRGAAGAGCRTDADCVFGLWCDHDADAGTGRCATKRAQGAACGSNEQCKGRCDLAAARDAGPGEHGTCASVCGSG
jgi:hypothetical protein